MCSQSHIYDRALAPRHRPPVLLHGYPGVGRRDPAAAALPHRIAIHPTSPRIMSQHGRCILMYIGFKHEVFRHSLCSNIPGFISESGNAWVASVHLGAVDCSGSPPPATKSCHLPHHIMMAVSCRLIIIALCPGTASIPPSLSHCRFRGSAPSP